MKVEGVGELGLLERIRPYLAQQSGRDDAAVIPSDRGFVVASCDMFVEGVHFDFAWTKAEDAGWRSLALALGDLAAKGATPSWALLALAMPKHWTVERLSGLYAGMAELASSVHLELVGGDMSSIEGPGVLSITVAGNTDVRPLSRAEARAGWSVAVTGPLGSAALALRDRRPHRLVPRLDEGRRLNQLGLCCGDISDGLVRELEKFAAMSGAGATLRSEAVPRAPGASVEDALTSGEEAELVCVGPPELIQRSGLFVVGELTRAPAVEVADARISRTGYDHFGR